MNLRLILTALLNLSVYLSLSALGWVMLLSLGWLVWHVSGVLAEAIYLLITPSPTY